ncbi:unnamed protein product, partial [Echinostoma caproni]|uniref:RPAP1_C domain-containing protein n=1 Tax=Echinostoma caproni TaxID=27848 RepID=A0A183AV85_9TREM
EVSSEVDGISSGSQSGQTASSISAPCQARFDLNGFVVPPEAVLDVHLGLHHHGEEPERAGYTVGELFHLARSSVPAQRRLALSGLAASLVQSRRGRHVPHLAPSYAPSLIHGLLAAPEFSNQSDANNGTNDVSGGGGSGGGIAFLLRWCLDEAVSALTSVSTAAAGVSDTGSAAGISLGLLVECVRGFACLLSDTLGETYLARALAWSSSWLSPPFLATRAHFSKRRQTLPGVTMRKLDPESEEDVDHSKAMCRDPVRFLFTESQLTRRLAWVLADGRGRPRARLSADAVGLWLPAMLIRGVRHSAELAYKIFSTPELFITLRDNFLPELETHMNHGASLSRPISLSEAYNLPLPSVLQLFRITMMSSPSIRLTMVNDLRIVERCLSYVSCTDCARLRSTTTVESLITHVPEQLPTSRGSALVASGMHCYHVYRALCESDLEDAIAQASLVVPLLTSWLSFLVVSFEQLMNQQTLCASWKPNPTVLGPWIDQIGSVCTELLRYARSVLQGRGEMPTLDDLEPLLRRNILSLDLLAITMTSTVRLIALQHQLDVSMKLPLQERLITLWNEHLYPLFELRLWPLLLERFQCNESVLTGSPATLADVDIITIPVWEIHSSEKDQSAAANPVDWDLLPSTSPIDLSLLEPVTLASNNMPDLGTAVCFRYRVSERNLGAFWWPKIGIGETNITASAESSRSLDECDPLAIDLSLATSRIQPIMAALIISDRALDKKLSYKTTPSMVAGN